MKKIISILLILVLTGIFCACDSHTTTTEDEALIRIHIRANSNNSSDQEVKLAVRDSVSTFLANELGNKTSYEIAYNTIKENIDLIEDIADKTLKDNGYSYASKARLTSEYFPTRAYDEVIVESGYYDALIIELGEGTGDNWWCVIYPPLCFLGEDCEGGVKYKSLISELILLLKSRSKK